MTPKEKATKYLEEVGNLMGTKGCLDAINIALKEQAKQIRRNIYKDFGSDETIIVSEVIKYIKWVKAK